MVWSIKYFDFLKYYLLLLNLFLNSLCFLNYTLMASLFMIIGSMRKNLNIAIELFLRHNDHVHIYPKLLYAWWKAK